MKEKITQQALNQIINSDLVLDGIIGTKSINAIRTLIKKLDTRYNNLGYSWYSHEIIGLRMTKTYTNKFTDWYILLNRDTPSKTRILPCSTLPGLYGFGGVLNPKTVYGRHGVAVMKPGQYKKCYRLQGIKKPMGNTYFDNWSGKTYLMQVGEVSVYRDGTKDWLIDYDENTVQTGYFGINQHSWRGHLSNIVNSLSQGCQVYRSDIHDMIVPFWFNLEKVQGNLLTYTLLDLA